MHRHRRVYGRNAIALILSLSAFIAWARIPSPDDEFADYEIWDTGNLDVSQAKTDDMPCLHAGAGPYVARLVHAQELKTVELISNRT